MKKQLVIIAVTLILLSVSLSGCQDIFQTENETSDEDQEPETGFEWFQIGNTKPITQLQTKQSKELEDNRIGSVGLDDGILPSGERPDLQAIIKEVTDLGLKHIRFTIVRIDYDRVDWDTPEFTFEPRHYDFIKGMAENGVIVKYLLHFRDDALGGEGRTYKPRFQTEEEIQRYLDYVRFIIRNVDGLVPYYEIFNEPNIGECVQWIEVEDYINLVKQVVPVIRQEDPNAKIALAGTTYLRESESQQYLFSILKSEIMPLVDVVSWHPMYGASPEFDSDYYYEYPAIVQQIKDTAYAHGFTGEFEAGEISWWTEQEPQAQEWGIWYSEIAAAKYHARGTVMHLGMDVRVTNNPIPSGYSSRQVVNSVIKNLCTIMAGARFINLSIEIQSEATNIRNYNFSLSNGDEIITLWTDGVAVDNDTGLRANLIIQNITSEEISAIDILEGFQQPLTANDENGNLTIQNLIVRDYPLILHIGKSSQ